MSADRVILNDDGFPVLLAEVPGSGIARIDPDAKSGNPRHDTRSGKFGAAPAKVKAEPPANVDPIEYKRMLDAVRDAAREFDTPDIGDVREFLAGRAKAPEQVDIERFLASVLEHRKNDLVDLLDQQMRSSGILPRGRRKIRISAPRGYLRKIFGEMDEDTMGELMHRLEAKGHDREQVESFFGSRAKEEKTTAAKARRDSFQASNQWIAEPVAFEVTDVTDVTDVSEQVELAVRLTREVVQNLQPPVVHVQPNIVVEAPRPTRKIPVRDEKGAIVEVREVPEEG